MLKPFFDHDFDHDILRGLKARLPEMDFTMAYLAGLSRSDDRNLLLWAAKAERVLISHDESTMPKHFGYLPERGENLGGAFVVPRRLPIRQMIEELSVIIGRTEHAEWNNILKILPL